MDSQTQSPYEPGSLSLVWTTIVDKCYTSTRLTTRSLLRSKAAQTDKAVSLGVPSPVSPASQVPPFAASMVVRYALSRVSHSEVGRYTHPVDHQRLSSRN